MQDSIAEIFEGAAAKYLTTVDADPGRSNQHEIGGLPSVGFLEYLGTPDKASEFHFDCLMAYAGDNDDIEVVNDSVTWYDVRRHNPHRSPEYRLYYRSNSVTELIQPGDFSLIGKKHDGTLVIFFGPADSSAEQQLRHLFGLEKLDEQFRQASMPAETLVLPIKLLLEEIGITAFQQTTAEEDLALLLERFPASFPKTSDLSRLARELSEFDCLDDPDTALVGWMEREEALFRAYEHHLVSIRLKEGFGPEGDDVDEFISFSLSVQNRRKSRVGHAFEHHLGYIFSRHRLQFEKGGSNRYTENRAKPDFLFPGFNAYHDSSFPEDKIILLGAKTTCKDRWRQVLSEGRRARKFLATLEAGISTYQTDEMRAHGLQLVVPGAIQQTYTQEQKQFLCNIADFIKGLKTNRYR